MRLAEMSYRRCRMSIPRHSRPPRLRTASLATASLALALLVAAHASAAGAPAAEPEHYVDRSFGFSFSKPRFAPSDETGAATVAVTLAGSSLGSLAPSVNVIVQNLETTLETYAQRQQGELKAIDWEVLEQSHSQIGGRPALRTHARGTLQGQGVEFLAVATTRDWKRLFVLTCTAASAQFPLYQAEFERVVTSFALEP